MAESTEGERVSMDDKWFTVFVLLLVIFCAGTPDLLDAITARVGGTTLAFSQCPPQTPGNTP